MQMSWRQRNPGARARFLRIGELRRIMRSSANFRRIWCMPCPAAGPRRHAHLERVATRWPGRPTKRRSNENHHRRKWNNAGRSLFSMTYPSQLTTHKFAPVQPVAEPVASSGARPKSQVSSNRWAWRSPPVPTMCLLAHLVEPGPARHNRIDAIVPCCPGPRMAPILSFRRCTLSLSIALSFSSPPRLARRRLDVKLHPARRLLQIARDSEEVYAHMDCHAARI
jgi:hypothetical protein